ncbi:MAG: hypothetical protein FWD89_03905 [Firmicutes bacterium]|nr:hypothetical protein [Bacillota bacterium]MCL2771428.1 hypothetical protein [Bacillota bacterium]
MDENIIRIPLNDRDIRNIIKYKEAQDATRNNKPHTWDEYTENANRWNISISEAEKSGMFPFLVTIDGKKSELVYVNTESAEEFRRNVQAMGGRISTTYVGGTPITVLYPAVPPKKEMPSNVVPEPQRYVIDEWDKAKQESYVMSRPQKLATSKKLSKQVNMTERLPE